MNNPERGEIKKDKYTGGPKEKGIFSDENKNEVEQTLPLIDKSIEEAQQKKGKREGVEKDIANLKKEREKILSDVTEEIEQSPHGEKLMNLVKPGDKEIFSKGDTGLDEEKRKKEKEIKEKEREIKDLYGSKPTIGKPPTEEMKKKGREKEKLEKEIKAIEKVKEKKEKAREEAEGRKENFLNWMTGKNNEGMSKEAAEMLYEEIYARKVRDVENERRKSDDTLVSEDKATDKIGRKEDPDIHVSPEEARKEMNLDLKRRGLREKPEKGRKVRVKKDSGELEEGWEIIEEGEWDNDGGKKVKVGKPDYTKPKGSGKYKEEKWVGLEELAEWTFPEDESKVEIIPDKKEEEIKKMEEQGKKRRQEQREMIERGAKYEYDEDVKRDVFKITPQQHKKAEREMKLDFAGRTIPGRAIGGVGRFLQAIGKGIWGALKSIPYLFALGFSSILEKVAKETKQDKKE